MGWNRVWLSTLTCFRSRTSGLLVLDDLGVAGLHFSTISSQIM